MESLAGGWEAKTGHNTPLYKNVNETTTDEPPSYMRSRYNCFAAIDAYIANGASPSQMLMGLALYGHGWQGEKTSLLPRKYLLFSSRSD